MLEKNRAERLRNQPSLCDLKCAREVTGDLVITGGHDPVEFERLSGRTVDSVACRKSLPLQLVHGDDGVLSSTPSCGEPAA
jgi:hypothetical protein